MSLNNVINSRGKSSTTHQFCSKQNFVRLLKRQTLRDLL